MNIDRQFGLFVNDWWLTKKQFASMQWIIVRKTWKKVKINTQKINTRNGTFRRNLENKFCVLSALMRDQTEFNQSELALITFSRLFFKQNKVKNWLEDYFTNGYLSFNIHTPLTGAKQWHFKAQEVVSQEPISLNFENELIKWEQIFFVLPSSWL